MEVSPSVESASLKAFRWVGSTIVIIFVLLLVFRAGADGKDNVANALASSSDYIGSTACGECHRAIYTVYSQTDMGRSMSVVTAELLEKVPNSTKIFEPKLNRHFEISVADGNLYQHDYEIAPDGAEVFHDGQKVEWIIGSGANGFGGVVQRGDTLFEGPLSFYSKTRTWGLSPGYESYDFGFSRPIVPECIACHSGRPQAIPGGNGRFLHPPFAELAVGCENCHGPGNTHATRMRERSRRENDSYFIVNPAKLPSWLADNLCVSCHQMADARVLQPGKTFQDFRPGEPLDRTVALLLIPPKRGATPRSDLLQHYFSMTLSKCYTSTQGKLSCITCHDPHVQPNSQAAPAVFRSRCLACHTEQSCAVPSRIRQSQNPPDDCGGCHMPKRDLKEISHSALTNHRIVRDSSENYPEIAFRLTTPELPDLVHLNAIPSERHNALPQITLLQAYGQLVGSHPEYRKAYIELAERLRSSAPDNIYVLEALAYGVSSNQSDEATATAIDYLSAAIHRGSTAPADFEQCASSLIRTRRFDEAVDILQQGIALIPHDAELHRLLGWCYLSQNKIREAQGVLLRASQKFPENSSIRSLLREAQVRRPQN